MKQPNVKLIPLANLVAANLPDGQMKDYCLSMAAYHAGTLADAPERPKNAPFYGDAVNNAVEAIMRTWSQRIEYHTDRIHAEVRRCGGVITPRRKVERPIAYIPQPRTMKV